MTATLTPCLGLISPVSTDDFKTTDFAQTFAVLDLNPGILNVANQASRPTTWTEKQHGRSVRQLDQGIDWYWYQPNSGTTGVWKRTSGKGVLYTQTNAAGVSSAATVYTSGATVVTTPSIILPGGRPIRVSVRWDTCGNSNGMSVGGYWEGATLTQIWYINGFDFPSNQWGRLGMSGNFQVVRDLAPTTQVSMSFKWTVSAYALGGPLGGTSTMRNTILVVEEV